MKHILNSLNTYIKWSTISRLSNQNVVKLTIFIPVFGYLILLNDWLIENLTVLGGEQSWNLILSYYGFSALGFGSLIYTLCCPKTIKDNQDIHKYIKNEQEAIHSYVLHETIREIYNMNIEFNHPESMCFGDNTINMLNSFKHAKSTRLQSHEIIGLYAKQLGKSGNFSTSEIVCEQAPSKEELMILHFSLLDQTRPLSRTIISILYCFGFALLSVPTAKTFYLVGKHAIQQFNL